MSLVPYKLTALARLDTSGLNIIPNASVSVFNRGTGTYSTLKTDSTGATPLSNPFTCDVNGEKEFWANGGNYSISVAGGQSWDISLNGDSDITKIDTWADIATTPISAAGQVFALAQHTSGGLGGGTLMAFAGSVTDDGGTQKNALGGFYLKRVVESHYTVQMFGLLGNATDETAIFNSAFLAVSNLGGGRLECLPGTFLAKDIVGQSNVEFFGHKKTTIIKRPNASTIGAILAFTGKNGWYVHDITLDGNKTNQTNGGHNLLIQSGCYDYKTSNIISKNAKANAGYGTGLVDTGSSNIANLKLSAHVFNEFSDNDADGLTVTISGGIIIDSNSCHGNSNNGIALTNLTNPPPISPTETRIFITNNDCTLNSYGIGITGYIASYTGGGLQNAGNSAPTASEVIIRGNRLKQNVKYGLTAQSMDLLIDGNIISNNGDSTLNGGCLLNMTRSRFVNNVVKNNYFYGVDAGGATSCTFAGGEIANNGVASGVGAQLNISAAQNIIVNAVSFSMLSTATGGACITVNSYDGGTDPIFPTPSSRNMIKCCEFNLSASGTYGVIGDTGDTQGLILENNDTFSGVVGNAYISTSSNFTRERNRHWISGNYAFQVASASTIVIPDAEQIIDVSGTAVIDNIRTTSQNNFFQKVRCCTMTANGSGYTPGTSTPVTFSGGGGSGATGYALVNNAGLVKAIVITAQGSGYTSVPTVAIGGAGTGATAVVRIGCNNIENNTITLRFYDACTLKSSTGNIILSADITTSAISMVKFYGKNGNWYLESKSS